MGKVTETLEKLLPRTWTPNQVVAHNVARARSLRGWTQEQAAEKLAPYLGTKLSHASFSAIERSIASTRVKQFSADDLVALSRGFRVPLSWWFTPPDDGAMHTPDHDHSGVDFAELVDLVLGTPDTLPPLAAALNRWAAERPEADTDIASPAAEARASELLEVRALSLVRERLGDLGNARDVLRGVADLLNGLDQLTTRAAVHAVDATGAESPRPPTQPAVERRPTER